MWRSGPLSLAYLTVEGVSPVEHVEVAAAAGFQAAGVRILGPSHLPLAEPVIGNAGLVARIRRACRETGVSLLDAEVLTLGPETNAVQIEPMLDTAAELGFRFVQTVCEDPDRDRAAERFAWLCDAAARRGLGVALEFMAFRTVRTVQAALDLLTRSAAPNAGIVIDALHLARSGGTAACVAALPAGAIALAQLCDAPRDAPGDLAREARTARLHLGAGALPLGDLLDALPDGVPLSVEIPGAFASSDQRENARGAYEATRNWLRARPTPGMGARSAREPPSPG